MGFRDGMALRAERKRLGPVLLPDERLIETDVCGLVTDEFDPEGGRIPGGQVALSFTGSAVYLRDTSGSAAAVRIPYERIVAVSAGGPNLEFSTSTGGDYLVHGLGKALADRYNLIDAEMRRRDGHRQSVALPDGSTAVLICRPLDEGGVPVWISAGAFDRDDPANRAAIEEALAPARERFGPVSWWP